jgi:hypothetical protein
MLLQQLLGFSLLQVSLLLLLGPLTDDLACLLAVGGAVTHLAGGAVGRQAQQAGAVRQLLCMANDMPAKA